MELTLKRSIQHVALCVDRVLGSIQHVVHSRTKYTTRSNINRNNIEKGVLRFC